jgi:hypothetical protein
MRNNEPDAVDRVLEEALSRYSSEEPLAGLEQRVLNRVRAEGATRRRLWPRGVTLWAAGVVVAAGAAFVAVAVMRPIPVPMRVLQPLPKPVPQLVAVAARPAKKRNTPAGLPRRREFPTPAPITREERALLALVEHAPDVAREAFLGLQPRTTEPIRLEEIKIEPLESDGLR